MTQEVKDHIGESCTNQIFLKIRNFDTFDVGKVKLCQFLQRKSQLMALSTQNLIQPRISSFTKTGLANDTIWNNGRHIPTQNLAANPQPPCDSKNQQNRNQKQISQISLLGFRLELIEMPYARVPFLNEVNLGFLKNKFLSSGFSLRTIQESKIHKTICQRTQNVRNKK